MKFRLKRITKYQYIIQKKYWFGWFNYFWDYPEDSFSLSKATELFDKIEDGNYQKRHKSVIKEIEI